MAKANKKAKTLSELTGKIEQGFKEWDSVFNTLIKTAEKGQMPLLVKSLKLDKEILNTYASAWKTQIEIELEKEGNKNA